MVQFSQSTCHFRSSLRRGSSQLLMVHVNSNQIQVMLLERAQARNSQGCANLTAGTVRMYGWAHAHIKVRIVKYGENSCKKWCCMVCHKTLLVRLPYYKSRHVLCSDGASQPRHSADASVPSTYCPIFSL